jgi:predicted amidohydrolase YtcJ
MMSSGGISARGCVCASEDIAGEDRPMTRDRFSDTGFTVMMAALLASPVAAQDAYVIHNAKIVTVDKAFSIAEAAAIKDGKFIAVGKTADVLKAAGPDARKIDMRGQTVLPGFSDSHVHLTSGERLEVQVDLTKVRSIADIKKALGDRIKTAKPGEWIIGTRGWWEYQLSDGRLPTRYDLDEIAPDNPVSIPGPHYSIVNSLALKLGGVTRDTPDPQGGEIYHDEKGEPTGLLMDNAGRFVRKFYPEPTLGQKMVGLKRVISLVNSNGITSAGDPGGSVEQAEMFQALHQLGQLTVRVDFSYSVDPAAPLDKIEAELKALPKPGYESGDGMFRADQLGEVGLDGAELTALLSKDYPTRPGYRGLQKVPQDQFNKFAALANRYGWRLRPHAVGDAAIDEALEAFSVADAEKSIRDRRWMIDHAFLLLPRHYAKVKELGVIINSQYMHNAQLGKLILAAWERPLADQSEMFRDWIANGIMFANGSDGPISYYAEPIYQIYGSVTRNTLWGGKLGPDQGISREDAIRSVTINGAYTSFEEDVKGSIEPGKFADFVVLSDDILKVPAETIKDIKVRATILGGKPVYGQLSPQIAAQ